MQRAVWHFGETPTGQLRYLDSILVASGSRFKITLPDACLWLVPTARHDCWHARSLGQWPTRCTNGCASSGSACPTVPPPARAIDYSLKRWAALTRYLDDGELPIDTNWAENRIRPIALGRQNLLFAGSLRAGKLAAAVMSLIHSAKFNGLDLYAYLRDVLERLPTQPASRIAELLPHRWAPTA